VPPVDDEIAIDLIEGVNGCSRDHICIVRNHEEGTADICQFSPCEFNAYQFHKHESIIRFYLRKERYEEAYDYFHAVLCKFDVCRWGMGSQTSTKQQPGEHTQPRTPDPESESECRVFTIKDELAQDLDVILDAPTSQQGEITQRKYIMNFKMKILNALKDVEIAALRNRAIRAQHDDLHEKRMDLIEKINENENTSLPFEIGQTVQEGLMEADYLDLDTGRMRNMYEKGKRADEKKKRDTKEEDSHPENNSSKRVHPHPRGRPR